MHVFLTSSCTYSLFITLSPKLSGHIRTSGGAIHTSIPGAGSPVPHRDLLPTDRSSILGDAIHASAWDKIQLKEAEMNRVPQQFAEERPQQPPVFTTHLQSYDRLTEQQSVHLEATVEPKTDPNLRVEWSKNGVPLMTGQWRGRWGGGGVGGRR